jgi:predicted lysophospholipase L1 biosynthesis ABC-type transport system permease subunit
MTRRSVRARRQMLPATLRSPAERREYLVAFGLVAVLQGAIGVALGVCALQTYRMWRNEVPYLPEPVGRVVPVALLLGAGLALAATLRTARTMRTVRRIPMDTGRADADGGGLPLPPG